LINKSTITNDNNNLKKELPFDDQNYVLLEYPDYLTNGGTKKVKVKELGNKFASINSFFMDYLKEYHIPAAFIKTHNGNSLKFIKHERLPFIVKILNLIDKRTAKIFSKKEGHSLKLPIFEYHYGIGRDSLVSESHLVTFDMCSIEDLKLINRICSKVNAVLKSFFERRGVTLAEVNCAFGKNENKIYLVDDFTPRSLKILPLNGDNKSISPYKFDTPATIRKYTDHLFNVMSS
jgi:phosphoribosylaminoimidazole-succinocarboxamide synthase